MKPLSQLKLFLIVQFPFIFQWINTIQVKLYDLTHSFQKQLQFRVGCMALFGALYFSIIIFNQIYLVPLFAGLMVVAIYLDWKQFWVNPTESKGNIILTFSDAQVYQSALAIVFFVDIVITLTTAYHPTIATLSGWVIGFGLYFLVLVYTCRQFSEYVLGTPARELVYKNVVSPFTKKVYDSRKWISIAGLSAGSESKNSKRNNLLRANYSQMRVPVEGEDSDISFLVRIPPQTKLYQSDRDLSEALVYGNGVNECNLCGKTEDIYLKYAVKRTRVAPFVLHTEDAKVCTSCVENVVMNAAEKDRIKTLQTEDLISQMI